MGRGGFRFRANATMVVSRTLQQHYRQEHNCDTIYVPNGGAMAPPRLPQKLVDWGLIPDNYVLFLGRFSPEKNCHLLINAFKNLGTDMKLVLAGGSSHSDSYATSLRRHESDQIRFLSLGLWRQSRRTSLERRRVRTSF